MVNLLTREINIWKPKEYTNRDFTKSLNFGNFYGTIKEKQTLFLFKG